MVFVGIDVGSSRAVFATASDGSVNSGKGGSTPSFVSFTPKRRLFGEQAHHMAVSNYQNTVSALNLFVGRAPEEVKAMWSCKMGEKDGEVAALVSYEGEDRVFSATELMAMFLAKLKRSIESDSGSIISECAISVPVFFSHAQRQAMLDAAAIAGLHNVRLMNDITAVAHCYGLTKSQAFSKANKMVCFVDIGFSSMRVAIVEYGKDKFEVKATAWEESLGGRDFDQVIIDHFALAVDGRAAVRLQLAAEKIKMFLSSHSSASAELETADEDHPLVMTREAFEGLSTKLLDRIEACLIRALEAADMSSDDVDVVELVGGTTKIPAVKHTVAKVMGMYGTRSLNQDEAVAMGCAYQSAIDTAAFKVKRGLLKEALPCPINLSWTGSSQYMEAFPLNAQLPATKSITINQPSITFLLKANSAQMKRTWKLSGPELDSSSDSTKKVRIDFALSSAGVLSIKRAVLVEEKMQYAGPDDVGIKKISTQTDLQVEELHQRPLRDCAVLEEAELRMAAKDKDADDLDASRNALEEYIYDARSLLDGALKPYVLPSDKDAILSVLSETESWLYSDETNLMGEYIAKLKSLKDALGPVSARQKQHQSRIDAEIELRQFIQETRQRAFAMELPQEDWAKVNTECTAKQTWLEARCAAQISNPLYVDPVVTGQEIAQQKAQLHIFVAQIFAKPPPRKTATKKKDSPECVCM